MKVPMDNILSSKAKKNKKEAEVKPYFENTHQVFTPNWIKYKNPSLLKEDEEQEEQEQEQPKGKALLKKIYGGACWKGYEQFGMKEKQGRKVPNCIPSKAPFLTKGGCGCQPKVLNKVVDNYSDVVNHLEEHLKEKAGDPLDAKQSKMLKGEIKKVNELHLIPALKVKATDPLYKVSNPKEVQKKAFELYGKDGIVYKSDKPKKKYQILDRRSGKWVHFGDATREDYTKHKCDKRKYSYLSRALGIKGNWRQNPFSANTLAIVLLW
jgi:hypothetical protein